jgi:multiple sugar transport system ATP-binding protein
MTAVTLTGLRKAYGKAVAVDSLDLRIESGEFVSLLGPSGCGKTTTLRMLAGLDYPTSGTIAIGERIVNELAPGKRDVAMVFQSYALYPHMTVGQNIAYPLRKRGVPRPARAAKVAEVARLLELEALLDRKPRQLSGGQQQRVALGRAIVRDPLVFLLDEPLSNLDAKLRAHMRAELIELHRRLGKTMIYVTHDQVEAMTMSDRIAVMQGGRLRQFATPAEIYNRPADSFVAGFIGTPSMTLLDGTLARVGAGLHATVGELTIRLPADHATLADAAPASVSIGVRPEDVLLGEEGHPGRIRLVEPIGHESIVLIDVGGVTVTARIRADIPVRTDEAVRVVLRASKLHIFDRPSGARLNLDRPSEPQRLQGSA